MEFYYVNSNNERINFYDYPYFFQEGNVLDYSYAYEKNNFDRIKNIRKEPEERQVKIAVFPDLSLPVQQRKEEYVKYANRLVEVLDYDAAFGKYGRLYSDTGYYLECMIIGSKKTSWRNTTSMMFNDMTVLIPNPCWINEKIQRFGGITNPIISTDGLDYAYDYAYDYLNMLTNQKIVVNGYVSSHFVMIIYGACENPAVSIGTHTYKVNTSLLTGEYLTIDTRNKKIIKTKNSGEQISVFNERDRSYSDFFEKIPAGTSMVAWSGGFGFDLTLYMERSEPTWI